MASELKEHKPQEGDLYALPNGVVFVVASYCFKVESAQPRIYLAIPPKMRPSQILGEPDFESPVFKKREFELYPMKHWTWLPTQAQLQEMIQDDLRWTFIIQSFSLFVREGDGWWHGFEKAPFPKPTMEQLWLLFIMKEKYNKEWNPKSKQWIKADSS